MKKLLILAAIIATASCTTIKQQNGAEVHQVKLDQITPSSTKAEVFSLLGSPSTKSVYGDETWYYITSKIEKQLVQDDKVLTQNVLAITFDPATTQVSNIELYGTDDKRDFANSDRITPTAGRKLSAIEQILGNVGKFNAESAGSTVGSRAPSGGRSPY